MAASETVAAVMPSDFSRPTESYQPKVNILLTSFAGLGLPRTLSLPVHPSTSISDVLQTISARLPDLSRRLIITTTDNKQLLSTDSSPIATLLPDSSSSTTLLPLRLSTRLCGGKGGFGSQLRAAGGRMSSRKKNQNRENANGSNRNLDGRRLRTIEEAKRLAEYLAIKPDMDKKEKEARKKRWESVVEAAEKREDEIRSGKVGANQGRLDAGYVEGKESAEEKTREAVLRAMREEMEDRQRTGSESDVEEETSDENREGSSSGSSSREMNVQSSSNGGGIFGWDDEDDEDSEDDEDNDVERRIDERVIETADVVETEHDSPETVKSKGKSKAR